MISDLYLHSKTEGKPLRIGVMIDGFQIPSVFREVLTDIQRSDFANLELVVVAKPGPPPERSSLYARFQKYDRRRLIRPNPLEPVDCTDILAACTRLDDAAPLPDLDLILKFSYQSVSSEILQGLRYGVWSFRYGVRADGPPLFREVVNDDPCSEASLRVETAREAVVLCTSIFPTARGHWPSRNVFQPYWGSAHFVIRKLHELHELGWDAVLRQAAPDPADPETDGGPSNSLMLRCVARATREELNHRLNPWHVQKADEWRICIRPADSPKIIAGESLDKSGFRWMPCPAGHYYADPILIQHQGQVWIFFEDYLYGQKRGRIACAPIQSDGSIGATAVCLDLPYHLSYPMVFHHDGEVFMLPESVASGSVALWRATEFPFAWKLEKTLFKGLFVDTTPILHEGRWYFFTAMLAKLHTHAAFGALFSSDILTGDWVRHPSTPISTDVREARPAGAIVRTGNRLLRPLQDCSENYGRRIHVEEILELSPESYKARQVGSIEPDWDPELRGVHTYAYCAGFEVLDAVRRRDRRLLA